MAEKSQKKTYSEDSIERHAGLGGIRKRPTPYLGTPNGSGLWTLIREAADNAVDRAMAGDNDYVHIVFDSTPNRYWVIDRGPGFPVGKKTFEDERGKKEKLSTFYVATGLTHAGANFNADNISRGVHGLGIKISNAMSQTFKVWTFRDGSWWLLEYKDAKPIDEVPKKLDKAPKLPHGLKVKRGSVILIEPDLSLFHKGSVIDKEEVRSWCGLTSYLVEGITVEVTSDSGKTTTIKSANGLRGYLEMRASKLGVTYEEKFFEHNSKLANVIVAFSTAEGDSINCYTNGLFNKDGGEHHRALTDALYKSLVPFMKLKKVKGKSEFPFQKRDLVDGLLGLINCKLAAPIFSTQTKDKLVDERIYEPLRTEFLAAWGLFWKKNKELAKQVIDRATTLRSKTTDFLKDKALVKNVRNAGSRVSTKLAAIVGKAPVERREIFLVEGDSAGGSLKRSRNKSFQAVMPLKGKPLNVCETAKEKINANTEIMGILNALGVDGKTSEPIAYGKVIIFADPDVDGCHIETLILATLYKFTSHLIKRGMVYSVKTPLFKCRYRDKVYFGSTREFLYEKLGTKNLDITYLKGLGELNESDLIQIAVDLKTRRLYRITMSDVKKAKDFELLMGKAPAYRKQLLGVQ